MFTRFVSIRFLFLRISTAAIAVLTGLIQTYVFARILSAERFSLFILVGAAGFTLLLCDLGIAKILFVQLRTGHLRGGNSRVIKEQVAAILILYVALALVGTFACFVLMLTMHSDTILEATEFALFFLFTSLNLAWFAFRNIAIAVDQYIFFESLEAIRRVANMFAMLAILIGLPLTAFLVLGDALWVVLIALIVSRLLQSGALAPEWRGCWRRLVTFFRQNREALVRSATFSLSELYVANLPFLIVPAIYGLGAPTIILDTTFKVMRAGTVAYSAACDLLLPRQTRAFNDRDGATLVRATLMAVAFCAIPAVICSAILIFAGPPLFAWLLGPAATMPVSVTPVIIGLLFSALAQMVAQSLLVHSGFFKPISRIGALMVLTTTGATALSVLAQLDIVSFLIVYAAVYAGGALTYVLLSIGGPIRIAYQVAALPEVAQR
jgi:O-antigen/teichoic acid export membrane protein